jgi:predicted nuclease with TOPRIM domain
MPKDSIPTDGDQPATQRDLGILAGEMSRRFDDVNQRFERIDERFDAIDERFDRLEARVTGIEDRLGAVERGQVRLLDLVESIDEQLKAWRHIPDKVERIHRRVFPHG